MIRAILIILLTISTAGGASTEAAHGMVASVHPTATEAGLRVLKEGGNAVDAAVAVALTLGVVDGDNSGIGGGCFIRGHFAQAVEQWMKSNGGIIRGAKSGRQGLRGRRRFPRGWQRGRVVIERLRSLEYQARWLRPSTNGIMSRD